MENLTKETFKDFIGSGKAVVDFWAEWCGPCKMMGPVFEKLSKEITDIKFAKLNVDENGEVAQEAMVRGIPTLILYKDGEEVDRIVGFLPEDALRKRLSSSFN